MNFQWSEYLNFAIDSAKLGHEAAWRSSISRAYYAAYCQARNKLSVRIPDKDSHKFVWDEYKSSRDTIKQFIGINGDRLRKKRKSADYFDEYRGDLNKDAEDAIVTAREIQSYLFTV